MATGGAWQSETFDNGRDYQKPVQYATQPAQVGTPPAMYNAPASAMRPANDRGAFGVLTVSLRIAQIVLTLIALAIMASNKQTLYSLYYSSSTDTLYEFSSTYKFSAIKPFVGVLAMNSIVCLYAIGQLVHSIVNKASSGAFVSSATTGFALLTFLFDTMLAYALVAAAAAGSYGAALLADGDYATTFKKFVQKGQASVAMTFLAFAPLAACALLYPIRLRKLASS